MGNNFAANINVRNPRPDDIPALRGIWESVFGTDGRDAFFRLFFSPEHAIVAGTGTVPAAIGFVVPAGELTGGAAAVKCAMLYAIATLPMHRGKGLGAAVTNALIGQAAELGYDAAVLCPSHEGLFGFYAQKTKMREWFYVYETGISTTFSSPRKGYGEQPGSHPGTLKLDKLTADQYSAAREKLLEGKVHIKQSIRCLEYQEMLCSEYSGGLYQIGSSYAVVEKQPSGAIWVKELLLDAADKENEITSAINAAFPSHEYVYRFPAAAGQGRRFGMIAPCSSMAEKALDEMTGRQEPGALLPWYGMAFD